jgi:tetratricopeptide (TPR) repeat protein
MKSATDFQARLRMARNHRLTRDFAEAATDYAGVLEGGAPEALQRTVLLELAQLALEQNDLARAQQVLAQWIERWPKDPAVPEVLLRQGLVFRQMGLHSRAIAKFYGVMTSSLVLKPGRFEYYQQLVLRAQNEIADVQFDLGNYAEAAESLNRLLRLESPPADRSRTQHRYIQCLIALGRGADALAQAQDFLGRYSDAPERAEVHFLCATALKQAGRNSEALRQVLALLQEQQRSGTNASATTVAYWQRRAGNEIANQFYQEGEPMKALDIYLRLAELDAAPDWQLPVWYQVGLVFERLNQPAKATEFYNKISTREKDLADKAAPSLKSVLEMAKWRKDFLGWQNQTELANVTLRSALRSPNQTNVPAPPLSVRPL